MPHPCVRCASPATVHLTKVVDGKPAEVHYCEQCAPTILLPHPNPGKEVAKLLKTFEPIQASLLLRRSADTQAVCPECGLTFAQFRQTGRFGCAHDYQAFGSQVGALLHSIHKASTYTGKTPGGLAQVRDGKLIDDLALAREKLDEAVSREDYEQAARLRDEIQQLAQQARGRKREPGSESPS